MSRIRIKVSTATKYGDKIASSTYTFQHVPSKEELQEWFSSCALPALGYIDMSFPDKSTNDE